MQACPGLAFHLCDKYLFKRNGPFIFLNFSNVLSLRKMNVAVKIAIDKREKDELFKGGTRKRLVKFCGLNFSKYNG